MFNFKRDFLKTTIFRLRGSGAARLKCISIIISNSSSNSSRKKRRRRKRDKKLLRPPQIPPFSLFDKEENDIFNGWYMKTYQNFFIFNFLSYYIVSVCWTPLQDIDLNTYNVIVIRWWCYVELFVRGGRK